MKKLKLKPSARDKRRYFFVNAKDNRKVEEAILEYIGVLGFAKSAYKFIKQNKEELVCSCLRESLNDVRAALSMAGFSIRKVSGTLAGLKR